MPVNAQTAVALFVEQLARDLNSGNLELPAFPDSVIRVQKALGDSDKDVDDVVEIVSSEPALVAHLLRLANSAALGASEGEIADVRTAVIRVGYKLVSTAAVSFAMRQLRLNKSYSAEARAQLGGLWKRSVNVAACARVIAAKYTRLNPDEALLTGLLHVLGHLYILMRSQDETGLSKDVLHMIVQDWHTAIARSIAETWNLSEGLATALEQQEDYDESFSGPITLTDVLLCAKILVERSAQGARSTPASREIPAIRRIEHAANAGVSVPLENLAGEVRQVRDSLLR